jgi:hypothetical protein
MYDFKVGSMGWGMYFLFYLVVQLVEHSSEFI